MQSYNPLSSINPQSKSQAASLAEEIKNRIIDGQLENGKPFPNEIKFSKELNVSRSTLREAYEILKAQGYITRSKKGTFIKDRRNIAISGQFNAALELVHYNDLIEFLLILEPEAVSLAAKRVTSDELSEIERLMIECENSKSYGAVEDLNYKFHSKIRQACHNPLIISSMSAAYDQYTKKFIHRLVFNDKNDFLKKCFHEHHELFDALKKHYSKKASKIAYHHLSEDIKQYRII